MASLLAFLAPFKVYILSALAIFFSYHLVKKEGKDEAVTSQAQKELRDKENEVQAAQNYQEVQQQLDDEKRILENDREAWLHAINRDFLSDELKRLYDTDPVRFVDENYHPGWNKKS